MDSAHVLSAALRRVRIATLGAILIVAMLTGLFVWQDRRETVVWAEERVMAFAAVADAYVRRRLRETEAGMKIIADLRGGELAGALAIREIAALHQRNFPFIEALGIIEAGRDDLLVGEPGMLKALAQWAASQAGDVGKLRVGKAMQPVPGAMHVIPLWLRFANGPDREAVVAVAAIRSDMLSLMHAALRLDANSLSVLVDGQGGVLAREPYAAAVIGMDISAADSFVDVPVAQQSSVRHFVSPVDGRQYLLGMSRLTDHGLSARAGELWGGAIAPWSERTERSVAFASILIVVIALMGRLAAQRVREEDRALHAKAATDALHRTALATLTEGVITHGLDGSILTFNPAALRILGLTGDQLRGLTSHDPRWRARREDGSDFPGSEHPVMQVLATGEPQLGVLMDLETGVGARRWIEINAVPIYTAGALSGAVVSFADVTAHHAMLSQLEVLNSSLEARVAERTRQLRQLGAELAAVEDRERRQISRDLHDDIAQTLAAARIRLARLAGETSDPARNVARSVGELIDRADASIRALASQLSPPALAEIGLVAGLEWLADEMNRLHGLAVEVKDDGAPKPLTQGARTVLFRAVRELLINVSKHAGVKQATVGCKCVDQRIVIEVRDSGSGYNQRHVATGRGGGLGLRSTYERLAHIGGRLDFTTPSGGGTLATVSAPLADAGSLVAETTT